MDENIVRHKGWDLFFVESFENRPSMFCSVCESEMDVQRNQLTPTSFVGAMAKVKSEQDIFTCPNSGEDWHKQVLALKLEAEKTASAKLTDIINNEIEIILMFKKPTKTEWNSI